MTFWQHLIFELVRDIILAGALFVSYKALRNAQRSKEISEKAKEITEKAQESELLIWVEAATATEVRIVEPPELVQAFASDLGGVDSGYRATLVSVKLIIANRSIQKANTVVFGTMELDDRPSDAGVVFVPQRAVLWSSPSKEWESSEHFKILRAKRDEIPGFVPEWRPRMTRFSNLRGMSIKPGDAIRDIYHDMLLPIGSLPKNPKNWFSISVHDIYDKAHESKARFYWAAQILDQNS